MFHVKWKCDIQVFSLQAYEGDVGPFMSVKIPIIFTPTIPGEAKLDFQIMFSQPGCEPVEFSHNYKQCFIFIYFIFASAQNINLTFSLFSECIDCGFSLWGGRERTCVGD